MTAMNSTATRTTTVNWKLLVLMLIGALLGSAVGAGLVHLVKGTGLSVKSLSWSDAVALVLGAGFVVLSAGTAIVAANRRQLGKALENRGERLLMEAGIEPAADLEEKLPATDEEVRMARTQAAVLGLAGILLMTPVFATAPIRNHPGLAVWIYAGVVVLFLAQTLLNLQLWQRGDEFVRKTILIVSAATFAVSQGGLFLWAAAERLRLVTDVSSWDLFTLLMAAYMAMSCAVSIRMRR